MSFFENLFNPKPSTETPVEEQVKPPVETQTEPQGENNDGENNDNERHNGLLDKNLNDFTKRLDGEDGFDKVA